MTTARLGLLVIATAIQAVTCCVADTYGLPPLMDFEWEEKIDQTPFKESTLIVVRSEEEWSAFWRRQDPQRKKLPEIDFRRQMVVGFVAGRDSMAIFRVELDDASNPKELLVRITVDGAPYVGTPAATVKGTRLHIVAVPRSALPVRFVKDDMVDGRGYGAYPEGVDRADLGRVAGLDNAEGVGKATYREQAEKLVRDQLKEEDMKAARAKLHPPSLGHRYPEPSSRIDVRRQEKTWTVVYDGMGFQVDVASGDVARLDPDGSTMETAMAQGCRIVGELEAKNPVLAGFSKACPEYVRDKTGVISANLTFRNNAHPFSKLGTTPINKALPYCYIQVSVWRPNNLPGQPVFSQRRYVIGGIKYEGYVLAFADDAALASRIQSIFEQEMEKVNADPERRTQPLGPPGGGK